MLLRDYDIARVVFPRQLSRGRNRHGSVEAGWTRSGKRITDGPAELAVNSHAGHGAYNNALCSPRRLQHILMSAELPPFNKVVSMIQREESRRKGMAGPQANAGEEPEAHALAAKFSNPKKFQNPFKPLFLDNSSFYIHQPTELWVAAAL